MPECCVFFHFEGKRYRVPPHDLCTISHGPGHARTDRPRRRRKALRPAADDAVFAKGGTARCDIRVAARIVRGIEHRLERVEPAFDWLIAACRRYQEVTRPSCRDVSHPDGLCPI